MDKVKGMLGVDNETESNFKDGVENVAGRDAASSEAADKAAGALSDAQKGAQNAGSETQNAMENAAQTLKDGAEGMKTRAQDTLDSAGNKMN